MKLLNKYSIHTVDGDYMSFTSKSLKKTRKECDKMNENSGRQHYCVMQHYMAPSSWDKEKIVEHLKKI